MIDLAEGIPAAAIAHDRTHENRPQGPNDAIGGDNAARCEKTAQIGSADAQSCYRRPIQRRFEVANVTPSNPVFANCGGIIFDVI